MCLFAPDAAVAGQLPAALTQKPYACVVVGGGLRKPDELVELFEVVIDLIRRHAGRHHVQHEPGDQPRRGTARLAVGESPRRRHRAPRRREVPREAKMGAVTIELDSSHVPMLSHPSDVLNVMRSAADALQRTEPPELHA